MARLTDEERSFRKIGAGVPFSRWWPILIVWIAVTLAASVIPDLFVTCIGHPMDGRGKALAAIRALLSIPCSPHLLRYGPWGWALFAGMWAPVPFAVVNWRWQKRHRAFWNKVRARENERRRLKRDERRKQKNVDARGA